MPQEARQLAKLFPAPRSMAWGKARLSRAESEFVFDSAGIPSGASLRIEKLDSAKSDEHYRLNINSDGILIESSSVQGVKIAAQTLRQLQMQMPENDGLPHLQIEDYPRLKTRGFMLDISRCKVPKMEELTRLVDILALFKFNRLELYTEHTYAFEGHALVWADASPMTPPQYDYLDNLCKFAGIELVANMNGLGHMERWLRYPEYQNLAESKAPFVDILGTVRKYPTTLYPDENALEFMDSLYAQFLPNFSSDKINIGGDEPWELGMGRSKGRCAKVGKYEIYIEHMLGLYKLIKARGKRPYFWADVLMQDKKYSKRLPEDMTPILWGYYLDHPYEEQCAYMNSLGRNFLVAPGTSTWNSFGLRWDCAKENIKTACDCAEKYGAEGALLTQWGDGGNHQPWCGMYLPIATAAAAMWNADATEDEICAALDFFVFADSTGEFSRALTVLGRADANQKLYSTHHKIFFARPEDISKILSDHSACDLDAMEASADFALSIAYGSSMRCADRVQNLSEFSLACDMIKFAANRARGDFAIETTEQRTALKNIVGDYQHVWMMRARVGGLAESADKIRALCPTLF